MKNFKMKHWILVNDKLKEVGLMTWMKWFQNGDSPGRITARTQVGKILISTVFLGIDHSFGGKKPVLWETMIFGSKKKLLADYQARYSSLEDAKTGHKIAVQMVKRFLEK